VPLPPQAPTLRSRPCGARQLRRPPRLGDANAQHSASCGTRCGCCTEILSPPASRRQHVHRPLPFALAQASIRPCLAGSASQTLRAPPTCTQIASRKVDPSRGTPAAAMAASARCASAARSAPSAAVTRSSYMNARRAAGGTRASRCASACCHCAPHLRTSPQQPPRGRQRRRPDGRASSTQISPSQPLGRVAARLCSASADNASSSGYFAAKPRVDALTSTKAVRQRRPRDVGCASRPLPLPIAVPSA
jgi:hypothetical protein